jgi:hypothetical protein
MIFRQYDVVCLLLALAEMATSRKTNLALFREMLDDLINRSIDQLSLNLFFGGRHCCHSVRLITRLLKKVKRIKQRMPQVTSVILL